MKASRLALLALLCAAPLAAQKPVPRTALFDGKTLHGWRQCNGSASYAAADGAIVGTTVEGSPNSFLCTEKEYGDFVLEFETKTEPALNSGVQIRSHRYAEDTTVRTFDGRQTSEHKHPAGRVYGYQVEISNEESGSSGGIYDEARRGWLDNTSSKPACRAAFKDNQWNRYRVEAIGDVVRTWVNGAECADLVDAADLTGFIGLQVHAFKGDKPAQVRWRNIRIADLGRHAWRPLWDGKSLNGWSSSPGATWSVEDGALHAISSVDDSRASLLSSNEKFRQVTARVRFKILKGNSGFFLRWDPGKRVGDEVEIDAEKRTGGFWEVGGRNWVTGPEDNANVLPGDWNELTAHVDGRRLVFHLNGVKTVDLPDDQGHGEGAIGLQCHGSKRPTDVWFKDVAVLVPEKSSRR